MSKNSFQSRWPVENSILWKCIIKSAGFTLSALAAIDYTIGCLELGAVELKRLDLAAKKLGVIWSGYYPRRTEIVRGIRRELTGKPFYEVTRSCGIKSTPAATKKLESRAIIEWLYLTLAGSLCAPSFELLRRRWFLVTSQAHAPICCAWFQDNSSINFTTQPRRTSF